GMLGGFIAWVLFAFFKFLDFQWYQDLLANIYNTRATAVIASASDQVQQLAKTLADETLLGVAFGTGISLTLSWMEERTQPRQLSWGRILLRTFMGLVISLIVFTIGFNLQYVGLLPNVFLSGLVTWLLFGIGIGFVLSFNSSIGFSRALLGGVIASVVGFCIYMLISSISLNFGLAKLISFIVLGGILGAILNTVVSSLEDFELEYISPVEFRGTNRISKWLRAGLEIFIGRQPGSTVYVKWEDEHVAPQHAKLSYVSGVVYIEALEETLIHNKMLPIGKKIALRDGDMIQLGRFSNTRMKYVERRKS
ncbi:MAG: FHA domain-containing protein, partial [Phaeodactylibacter sp.]|nr:FHA domain-containing protein [Phaeodactylibacter sp.]